MTEQVHILGLSARDQYLVKLVLTNMMSGYMYKTIHEMPSTTDSDAIESKSRIVLGVFRKFNDIIDLLCTESNIARARPKVLMFAPGVMKYIVMAFNGYDPSNNFLSPDERAMLHSNLEGLKKKVADSYKFTYNKWEIERARNS